MANEVEENATDRKHQDSVQEETISFRHDECRSGEVTPKSCSFFCTAKKIVKNFRGTRIQEAGVLFAELPRHLCRDYIQGARNSHVISGILRMPELPETIRVQIRRSVLSSTNRLKGNQTKSRE